MKILRPIKKLMSDTFKARMPGFDEVYYCYWYRDIAHFSGTPLQHYLQHGWREGRDPSAGFSTDGYLAANSDVAESDQNPLTHFLDHGLAEGRRGGEKDPKASAPAPRHVPSSAQQKLLAPPKAV